MKTFASKNWKNKKKIRVKIKLSEKNYLDWTKDLSYFVRWKKNSVYCGLQRRTEDATIRINHRCRTKRWVAIMNAVEVRGGYKYYGSEKDPKIILNRLDMNVSHGSM